MRLSQQSLTKPSCILIQRCQDGPKIPSQRQEILSTLIHNLTNLHRRTLLVLIANINDDLTDHRVDPMFTGFFGNFLKEITILAINQTYVPSPGAGCLKRLAIEHQRRSYYSGADLEQASLSIDET
jgi:hypothetical protein